MIQEAIKNLLIKMADDELIIGHRNSEWTGFGPVMEEDIAFSSMAQDKIGHALNLYNLLHAQYNNPDADTFAFTRDEKEFKCSHFVEMPNNGDYAFSLMRHFLFDTAESIRYEDLQNSAIPELATIATKFKGELKYHTLHANTWVRMLGAQGTEDSHARMQQALNQAYAPALALFEASTQYEDLLIQNKVYSGEVELQKRWLQRIEPLIEKATLKIPSVQPNNTQEFTGGRHGYHTIHLQPLITEMTSVYRLDVNTQW
jgi:ring-1,2-phenylacetyl-CoA epoxidase subunit PaaC